MQDIKLCVLFAPNCLKKKKDHQTQTWKKQSLSVNSGPFWVDEWWKVVSASLFSVLTIDTRIERIQTKEGSVEKTKAL